MSTDASVGTHAIAFLSALSGGFFGAASAFMFEQYRAKKRKEDENYAALLHAQYIIAAQCNSLLGIKIQHLDKLRDNELRFTKLVPFYVPEVSMELPLKELAFIVERADASALQQIHLTYTNYRAAIDALMARNTYQQEEMYGDGVKIHAFDFSSGSAEITMDAGKARILKALTDCLYECVDEGIKKHQKCMDDTGVLIKTLFPKRKKLVLEPVKSGEEL